MAERGRELVWGTVRNALAAVIRTLAGSERLDELPEAGRERPRGSFLAWLTSGETLPLDEPRAARPRSSLLSLIFSKDPPTRD